MSQEKKFLDIQEALSQVLERVPVLEAEEIPILESLGRVLAEEIVATEDIPPFVSAVMDGYAVRGQEIAGASPETPVRLQLLGEVTAGSVSEHAVEPGSAVRIMTGAPLPPGADTVVPFEQTDQAEAGWVQVMAPIRPGGHIRGPGGDVHRGEKVLERGIRLHPRDVGLLASLGRPRIHVTRRPRVAVLATGDELVDVDQPLAPGKIRGSNTYSNYALVRKYGGEPLSLPLAGDRFEEISARIDEGLAWGADLLLTSGGTALGVHDLLKEILARRGRVIFWQVRIQPGRPVVFGEVEEVPLLGLPGNPISCWVAFELLARPALLKMQGQRDLGKPEVQATLLSDVKAYRDRVRFLGAVVEPAADGGYTARLTRRQGVGRLTSMAQANGLVVVPAEAYPVLKAGSTVRVVMLGVGG
jgi:molybdopterin molybdotransferase